MEVARAEVLLAQGRASEAIAGLRLASTGNHDAMGRYVPRSELDWWLAVAFRAAGQGDSARVYADHVRRAWRAADPEATRLLDALRGI
ncbi:MAG TPA: hypothetical protein VFY16_13430 [Gemmatimonadaceae bacterium]|nr:hypothetical protein [Gemmatimonadaceae bacterium]